MYQFVLSYYTVHTYINRTPLRFYLLLIEKSLVLAAVPAQIAGPLIIGNVLTYLSTKATHYINFPYLLRYLIYVI